ncbi:hypothetical protein [Paenibacillus sp. IHBB 10380]|uniref:hypothetical protein n=1 Tax=Paenibacillus sp. IHBB 10380 TaxID=1566358 RepID=UPI0005CFD488|nr:hypothetical protein [Paenibacillus sp. IHBB 10380]AJS59878.1 hypothetical protein UB51_16915 [Paenibacillus sp. IHBB 10380]
MTESAREPNISDLLNQFEAISGPEEYGPEGLAIMVALWRKSCKLGWRSAFQMTNTELMVQSGIKSRSTINTHRSKLVSAGIIGYTSPPRGGSRGDYIVSFDLIAVEEVVQNLDMVVGEVVQNLNHYKKVVHEPVQNLDSFSKVDEKVVQNLDTVLKDLITITTTPITSEFAEEFSEDSKADGMIGILNAYSKLHGKFDFHVKPREREAMGKMVAGGMPNPFTIQTMTFLLEEKRKREGSRFKLPTSFLYYVDAIEEAWLNSQTTSTPMAGVAPRAPEPSKRKSKQQQEIERLESIMREEEAKRA